MTREQLIELLDQQRLTWDQESTCVLMDHEGHIDQLRAEIARLVEGIKQFIEDAVTT